MRRGRTGQAVPVWLSTDSPPEAFPAPEQALREPNGLLALGGDLSPARLLHAYSRGIFPWYSEGQPILWWSPAPRAVLFPSQVHVSRSLAKTRRQGRFELSIDRSFDEVVEQCAAPRDGEPGTWITPEMKRAYGVLHRRGHACSIEAWCDGRLAGGLYGVVLGRVFFGESMFSRVRDASKIALVHLCSLGYELVDCQMSNPHLHRMGAVCIPRHDFQALLRRWCEAPARREEGERR